MELEGTYEAIESNPLLNAGIQIKVYLTEGCLIFSWMCPALESSLPPEVIGSIVILLD